MDRNEQHSERGAYQAASWYRASSCTPQQQQTHISEDVQAQIDRIILQSRQEAEQYKLKYEDSRSELCETRRELNSVREENEALRFQSALREEEFLSEQKERRRTQAELQRTRAQLQQLQREIAERPWLGEPRPYEHRPRHFTRVGIDVCDNASSDCTADHPTQDHTRSSPIGSDGGRRQSPVTDSRPISRTNSDVDLQPTTPSNKQFI